MAVKLGPMELIASEAADVIESQVTGTDADGGFWTNWTRLSGHDHSGGLMGAPVAVSIPDGSITAADLDPSVLAPYALTDGSKPFTGQVTLQADAVVRDRVSFGEQGTALAPDAHLTRTGAGALRVEGAPGLVTIAGAGNGLILDDRNGSASGQHYLYRQGGTLHVLHGGVGDRLAIGPTGTTTLSPDAPNAALIAGGPILGSPTDLVVWTMGGGALRPLADGSMNVGSPTFKYGTVYAVTGAIQTSAAEAKEDITPLDPAAALAAVLATDPVTFTYTAPAPTAQHYDLPDDPEQAERVLHQRLVDAPLLEAARHQAGFVLKSADYATDPLFETGDGQSNAANTAGILLAALKELDRRLVALEEGTE